MNRLKKKTVKALIDLFNFHDIKAQGISNTQGEKLDALGHQGPKMLQIYDRKKAVVNATE
ncbi:MAG: hypothetical protein MUQ51_00415 [Pseudomonadota bacterium]|nr:hypothetical protein [Pseudomonadota bacterium]MDO7710074.1 hypothetical protein [Pseudomonadota bacterium]